jgi:hypothetical protein
MGVRAARRFGEPAADAVFLGSARAGASDAGFPLFNGPLNRHPFVKINVFGLRALWKP